MNKVLVIGASGQVGGAVLRVLNQKGIPATGTYHQHKVDGLVQLNLSDKKSVERLIVATKPDWIVYASAMSHVDYCESHPDEAMDANCIQVLNAARYGQELGAGFIFYSSEYVFDGKSGPYSETDIANPLSVYAKTKWEAENALQTNIEKCLILRTTVVYGPEHQGKNFVLRAIKTLRDKKELKVPRDQVSSPTYNPDLAMATVELAEKNQTGIFNVTGPEVINRYDFTRKVCREFDLPQDKVIAVLTSDFNQPAPRPLNGGLKIDKLMKVISRPMRSTDDGLKDLRSQLNIQTELQI